MAKVESYNSYVVRTGLRDQSHSAMDGLWMVTHNKEFWHQGKWYDAQGLFKVDPTSTKILAGKKLQTMIASRCPLPVDYDHESTELVW